MAGIGSHSTQNANADSSTDPDGASVRLNADELQWDGKGELPRLEGAATAKGDVTFAPGTISFLAVPGASNRACR